MRQDKPQLLVTVFTDYICPFCYIGDVRMERLREVYDLRINWCFLEIHPETPPEGMQTSRLGYSDPLWVQMMENLDVLAREEGIHLRPHDFTTNSHKALLLAEAAREEGAGTFYRLHRRLFEVFFSEGRNIGDAAVLRELARESGVGDETVRRAWEDERYQNRLGQYRAAAHELDVCATPTIFFGERHRLDGVLPYSAFLDAALAGAGEQNAGKS